MSRIRTIDGLVLHRLQLLRDPDGSVRVFAEYDLCSGGNTIEAVHREITTQLTGGRRTALASALQAVARDLDALELV